MATLGRWWKDSLPSLEGNRPFLVAVALDELGNGIFLPFAVTYFVLHTDLSLAQAGPAVSAAALLALPVAPLLGRVVGTSSPPLVLASCNGVAAVSFALYPAADTVGAVTGLVFATLASSGVFWMTVPRVLKSLSADRDELGRWYSLDRTVRNLGLGLGAVASTTVLATAGVSVINVIVWAQVLSFGAAGLLLLLWGRRDRTWAARPAREASGTLEEQGPGLWHDRRFWALAGVNALCVLALNAVLILLPIALVSRGGVRESWVAGAVIALNTVVIVLAQIPVGRASERWPPASRLRWPVVLLAASVVLFGTGSVSLSGAYLVALCLVAATVYTVGEMLHTSGISPEVVDSMPSSSASGYLAVNQLSWSLPNAVSYGFYAAAFSAAPLTAWLVPAALLVAGGLPLLWAADRAAPASRTRVEARS